MTQIISNAFALNNSTATATTLQLRGDDQLELSGIITNTQFSSTLTANMEAKASATLSGTINLSESATNRTLTFNNNTFGPTDMLTVAGGDFIISGQIVNGSTSTAGAVSKGGSGLVVLSGNNNTYGGLTTVAGGTLRVTANGALGTAATQTQVNNGFTLQVIAGLNIAEPLVINNNGLGNLGRLRFIDQQPGTAQTTTWSGPVNFNATTFVGVDGVDANGANADRLIFTGAIATAGGALTKVGRGEVEFAGTVDGGANPAFPGSPGTNTFGNGLEVRAGTVYLNKTGTTRVVVGGTVTVGDGGGGDNADRLIIIGAGTDHIADALTVTVGSSGLFTLGGSSASETIANLILTTGQSNSADVDTTTTRTLTVTSNVTVNTFNVTDGTAPAAQIAGKIAVNGTFTVNETFVPSASRRPRCDG